MKSTKQLVLLLGGCGAFALAGLGGMKAYAFRWPGGPPRGVVESPDRRIVSKWPPEEIVAVYSIVNKGGQDLVFGEISTTCGCTEAKVDSKVVKPRGKAQLTVRGNPPSAGVTQVQVTVQTNQRPAQMLVANLTMVGSSPPPFVASHNGPISLGPIRRNSPPAILNIDTREEQQKQPWLQHASVTLPFVALNGGLVVERPIGGGVVLRRYEFEIKVKVVPAPGEFSGEVFFRNDDAEARIIPSIPVHGRVNPKVFASPKRLYAVMAPGQEKPSLTVIMTADDADFELDVDSSPANGKMVEVRRLKRDKNRVFLSVSPRSDVSMPLSTTLVFPTNHPDCPVVEVPLTIRALDAGVASIAGEPGARAEK